jgi:hypothetical protein
MKTTHYGLLMAAILFFFAGCEKNDVQSPLKGKKPAASEKAVPIISVSKGYECTRVVCNMWSGPAGSYNAIYITNENEALSSVRYTLYRRISENLATGEEVYQPFAAFNCDMDISTYASSALDNGSHLLVYASDPAYTSPSTTANVTLVFGVMQNQLPHTAYRTITAGNYEGGFCGPGDLKAH